MRTIVPCPTCNDSGWRPGDGVWRPFLNDAFICECGALRRNRYAEKIAAGFVPAEGGQVGSLAFRNSDGTWSVFHPHDMMYSTMSMVATHYWHTEYEQWVSTD